MDAHTDILYENYELVYGTVYIEALVFVECNITVNNYTEMFQISNVNFQCIIHLVQTAQVISFPSLYGGQGSDKHLASTV